MKTVVVHRNKARFDVLIDRSSIWGNPYEIGVHGTRAEVIELYRKYLNRSPELIGQLESLRGKKLGCWCEPLACHGDVIVDLIEIPTLW